MGKTPHQKRRRIAPRIYPELNFIPFQISQAIAIPSCWHGDSACGGGDRGRHQPVQMVLAHALQIQLV
jgi:hypothetical protein